MMRGGPAAAPALLAGTTTMRMTAQQYHTRNPHVYETLRQVTLTAKRNGQRPGIKAICERLRGAECRLNNNYVAWYARFLMEQEPELRGFFLTRRPVDEDAAREAASEAAYAQTLRECGIVSAVVPDLTQELEDAKDRLLRAGAEFENYRRRIERERHEIGARAIDGLLLDLLPVADDMERALAATAESETETVLRGVGLIRQRLMSLLKRRNVVPFDAVGQEFDPTIHQAVTTEEGQVGQVVSQFYSGYMSGERLLRPAMVAVGVAAVEDAA